MLRACSKLLLVSILVIAEGVSQTPPNPTATDVPKKFDVASIRPSADRSGQSGDWMGTRINGGTFESRRTSLKALVWFAYAKEGPERRMVSGGGGWIDSQEWDVVAKVDDPSLAKLSDVERRSRVRPMVQALLEGRFKLRLHSELRPTPVYALVQAKGGAKVKEVPAPLDAQGDRMEVMRRFSDENPGKPFPGSITCGSGLCTATAVTISEAIPQIAGSSRADRLVIDKTGLNGHYDLSFRMPHGDDDDAMSEIEEDLRVRFEPRKVDLMKFVIDSAERPSPN